VREPKVSYVLAELTEPGRVDDDLPILLCRLRDVLHRFALEGHAQGYALLLDPSQIVGRVDRQGRPRRPDRAWRTV
jgi:hypothetical protein